MIDTVILRIPYSSTAITNPRRFGLFAEELNRPVSRFRKYENNPTVEELESGYFPRLTLVKRPSKEGNNMFLHIEFSCPKTFFNNNVEELRMEDFEEVITKLKEKICIMGVNVERDVLEEASFSGFDVSKNFIISDGYTSNYAIRQLGKLNIPMIFDVDEARFRNNGSSLQMHTKNCSIVFYDKKEDLKKSKSRAIDKDYNKEQNRFIDDITDKEILRYEIRIRGVRKLKALAETIGFKTPKTFSDLLNKDLSRSILEHHWDKLVLQRNLFTFDLVEGPLKMLENIMTRKKVGLKQGIYLTGLALLSKDEGGIRALRTITKPHICYRSWLRLQKDLQSIPITIPHSWVPQVTHQLADFVPIQLSTLNVKKSKV